MEKSRFWTFLLYQDSCNLDDFIDFVNLQGFMCAISPIHDKDINEDGSLKKAHYHVIINYGNSTTYNNIVNLFSEFGVKHAEKVVSLSGLFNYLTHESNKNKFHYNRDDIKLLNGFKFGSNDNDAFMSTFKSVYNVIQYPDIHTLIDLVHYFVCHNGADEIKYISSHAYFIDKLLN